MHTILQSYPLNHGHLCIVKCRTGYLRSVCRVEPFSCGELVEVVPNTDITQSTYWHIGVFEYSQLCIRPIAWDMDYEVLASTSCVPSEDWSVWIELNRFNLAQGYDYRSLQQAVEAQERLEQAKNEYASTMRSLGFREHSRGNWQDTESWYALTGLPFVQFPVEE